MATTFNPALWLKKVSFDETFAKRASWVVFAVAGLITLIHFAGGRVLWLDEAMIALNLRELGWNEIVGGLQYAQMAPIGWLFTQKALFELTGSLEYGLRALSLVAWIGSALFFRDLCFRIFTPFAAVCCFALFAFSTVLLKYAVELKHYGIDVFVATAALWACFSILANERSAWRSWLVFGVAAVIGVFFCFGALFAIAGCGLTLLIYSLRSRRIDRVMLLGGIGLPCVIVFGWLMLKIYPSMVSSSGLTEGGADAFFHRTSYMPIPTSLGDLLWAPKWIWDFLLYAFTPDSRIAAALLIAGGAVALLYRKPYLLFATIGPLVIGLLASGVHAYPMFERLALFALPGLYLTMGFAIAWLAERLSNFRLPALALVATAMIGPLMFTAYNVRQSPPYANQDIHPVMTALGQTIKPSDRIYVANLAIPAWLLYREKYGLEQHQWMPGRANIVSWPCIVRDMPFLKPNDTLWVIAVQDQAELPEAYLSDSLALMGLSATHEIAAATDGVTLHKIGLSAAGTPPSKLPEMECGTVGPGVRLYPPPRFSDQTIIN